MKDKLPRTPTHSSSYLNCSSKDWETCERVLATSSLTSPNTLSRQLRPINFIPYNKRYKRVAACIAAAMTTAFFFLLLRLYEPQRHTFAKSASDLREIPSFQLWSKHIQAQEINPEDFHSRPKQRIEISRQPSNDSLLDTDNPLSYIHYARSASNQHQLSSRCDYYNNADFIVDFHAYPFVVCGSDTKTADTWRFGYLQDDEKSYLQKRNALAGPNIYRESIFPLRREVSDYLDAREDRRLLFEKLNEGKILGDSKVKEADDRIDTMGSSTLLWRRSKQPITLKRKSKTASQIRCGVVDEKIPQRYCETRNIAVKLEMVPQVNSEKGLDLLPPFGLLETMCHLDENSWFGQGFGGGAAGWMLEGLEILRPSENDDIKCDLWLDTPLFFISRWDTTNPYQFHQDALNTFLVYSLFNLSTASTQPILLDQRKADGPYTAAWSHIFTNSRRLVDIRQLSEAAKKQLQGWKGKSSPNLCLSRAIWGIHGGISPMARGANKPNECSNAPLSFAFREFMLDRAKYWATTTRGFGGIGDVMGGNNNWLPLPVQSRKYGVLFEEKVREMVESALGETNEKVRLEKLEAANALSTRTIVVTYAIRKSATRHGALEENGTFGTQLHGADGEELKPPAESVAGTEPTLRRLVENEKDLISSIKRIVKEWRKTVEESEDGKTSVEVEFRAVDFASISFDDQIAIAHGTDLFVGPHGAAFAYTTYLRRMPFAGVLELKPPERGIGNHQFQNMAKRYGNKYMFVPIGHGVESKHLSKITRSLRLLLTAIYKARLGDTKDIVPIVVDDDDMPKIYRNFYR